MSSQSLTKSLMMFGEARPTASLPAYKQGRAKKFFVKVALSWVDCVMCNSYRIWEPGGGLSAGFVPDWNIRIPSRLPGDVGPEIPENQVGQGRLGGV